jgi:AAA15 family ATPase/GTPase
MLIQFNFKNYKSFRDETTLDLSATNITEFSERVEKVNGEKILPVAAIYGANASGKSNVYSAFAFMSKYVLNSFNYGDDRKEYDEVRPSPFLFDSKSEAEDTTFEVYFTLPKDQSEYVYNYGFCLGIEGVTEEWLNYRVANSEKSKTIFYRDKDTLDLSGISKKSRDNIKIALEQQVLVASLGAKLKINECKMVRDWFKENEFADFGNAVSNFFLSRMLPSGFVEDASVQDDVVNFFSSFDDQIKGFEVNKIPSPDNDKAERYTIDALHKKLNSEELAKIPLSSESAGTLKMFAL